MKLDDEQRFSGMRVSVEGVKALPLDNPPLDEKTEAAIVCVVNCITGHDLHDQLKGDYRTTSEKIDALRARICQLQDEAKREGWNDGAAKALQQNKDWETIADWLRKKNRGTRRNSI